MEIVKKVKMSRLLEIYGVLLTENQRDIASLYYDMDMSLKEISEQHGDVSRQAVRDTILRVDKILLDYENKLKLLTKSDKLDETIARLFALDLDNATRDELDNLRGLI